MNKKIKAYPPTAVEWFSYICFLLLVFVGLCDVIRHVLLDAWLPVATMMIIQTMVLLIGWSSYSSQRPWLMILPCAFLIFLHQFLNYSATTMFNAGVLVSALICSVWTIAGSIMFFASKHTRGKLPLTPLCILGGLVVVLLTVWLTMTASSKLYQGDAHLTVWGVPIKWEQPQRDPNQCGTVEEVFYPTKAYGTDGRELTKSALVYLPAGYDENKQYDILYLLHGTGDDQYYWLQTHEKNKYMLDNLIAAQVIEPLIVVTPTFYCERECVDTASSLDTLTYVFQQELRNDLIPCIESRYSTYAADTSVEGLISSRDHRAFAGLSRGATTTYRSVMYGCLDYVSWFGTFSGSRISIDAYMEKAQSLEFSKYGINYLYVASGNFDFALPRQLEDYAAMMKVESRLQEGVNTRFDIFPMRWHSMGNWHLALYNFLQCIF